MLILFVIFSALVGIQLIYLIVFLVAISKKRTATQTERLPVSIIICAHDEEENLKELIPELLAQDYPEFEIVVVDDRSNDTTFDWLLEETSKDHRLRMVHVNRTPPHVNGKKYGITLGIKAAKYEWILLTDADCRPLTKQWIASMSAQFNESTSFVLGTSPYVKVPGLLNAFIRFETLLTALQYISFASLGNPYMGVGRNMAYRKSMFLQKKGFNNFLNVTGGDDDLFVNQHATGKNTKVVIGEESLIYSLPETTWSSFFRQKTRHLSVGKLYRFGHRFLLGLFTLTWLLTWFGGIPLAFVPEFTYLVVGALLFRMLFLVMVANMAAKRFGVRFEVWLVPLLDFIYAFYYLVTGLMALVSKKVRWKN
ncbi:glycosyltransferase [Ohtaekwangia sp.]|uniref:glycosyltransferase n=1 Tax=Ohtaekwangia sp. TaxID=2066019 RepID=UPI002F93F571